MSKDKHSGAGCRNLAAELGIDPTDKPLIEAATRLRSLRDEPPNEAAAARHVKGAAALAAEVAGAADRTRHRGLVVMTRAAAVAAGLLIATGGAAYAGVLPDSFGSTVDQIASTFGLGEPRVDDGVVDNSKIDDSKDGSVEVIEHPIAAAEGKEPPTTDTTAAPKSDQREPKSESERPDVKPVVREMPEEMAAMLRSVADYRTAAREWRRCLMGDRGVDSEPADIQSCGDTPTPEEFGITDGALAELSEKAQRRISRLVDPITAKLTCIESHLGDRTAMRECVAAAGLESKKDSKNSEPPREDQDAKPRHRSRTDDPTDRDERDRGARRSGELPAQREPLERERLEDGGNKRHKR